MRTYRTDGADRCGRCRAMADRAELELDLEGTPLCPRCRADAAGEALEATYASLGRTRFCPACGTATVKPRARSLGASIRCTSCGAASSLLGTRGYVVVTLGAMVALTVAGVNRWLPGFVASLAAGLLILGRDVVVRRTWRGASREEELAAADARRRAVRG